MESVTVEKLKNDDNKQILKNDDNKQILKVVFAGAVDAGKSTLSGVLATNILDNGRGTIRDLTTNIPHEKLTSSKTYGRTSKIGHKFAHYDDCKDTKDIKHLVIEMHDLCGHANYLKTTISGITGSFADYGIIVIGSNMGLNRMTEEHIKLLYYLKIPFVIILTKIDMCPKNKYTETKKDIKNLLDKKFNPKKPLFIERTENVDINKIIENMTTNSPLINVISVSNTTGININFFKQFLFSLPIRQTEFINKVRDYSLFVVESVYFVDGVGIVVSGTNFNKIITVGQKLYIGPVGGFNGAWTQFRVRSLHNNHRQSVQEIHPKMTGCIACKFEKKDEITRNSIKVNMGIVIVSDYEKANNNVTNAFVAKVKIFHHSTTITPGFCATINCNTVRQPAKMMFNKVNPQKYLRSDEEAIVVFKLLKRSCYFEEGNDFFFSEGQTRGLGKIIKLKLNNLDDYTDEKVSREEKQKIKHILKDQSIVDDSIKTV
jgi:elongation factor 1-alpha